MYQLACPHIWESTCFSWQITTQLSRLSTLIATRCSRARLNTHARSVTAARAARGARGVFILRFWIFAKAAIAKRLENKLVHPAQIIPQVHRNHSAKRNRPHRQLASRLVRRKIIILTVVCTSLSFLGHPSVREQRNQPQPCRKYSYC